MKASSATTRVVIAGGGFAGLYAAKEFERILAGRSEIEQTITARDIEATAEQIARVRARRNNIPRGLQPEALTPNRTDTYAVR